MKYAKLAGDYPSYHGIRNPIVNADGSKTVTKNEKLLLAAGFLPVTDTPAPDDGSYVSTWEATDSAIVRVWREVLEEAPEVEE